MTKKAVIANERSVPLLFDPEGLGRSLREVAIDVIETEGATIFTRWFHSTNDVDLLIWSDEARNVIKHQVNFFGQVVEWSVFEGVKTGFIIEEDAAAGAGGDGEGELSETIQFDPTPESNAIRQALMLLEHVPDLDGADKSRIRDNLLNRADGRPDPGGEFLRLYGEARKWDGETRGRDRAAYKARAKRPGFWRRIRKWFSGAG